MRNLSINDSSETEPLLPNRRPRVLKLIFIGFLLVVGGIFFDSRQRKREREDYVDPVSHPDPKSKDAVNITYIKNEYLKGVLDVCQMPYAAVVCEGNLGIARGEMPQLTHAVAEKYGIKKKKQGLRVESTVLPPNQLLPVQKEISADRILDMYDRYEKGQFDPCAHEITVSVHKGENRIINGHHHWLTCMLTDNVNQRVMAIGDSVANILHELKHFKDVIYTNSSAILFFKLPGSAGKAADQPKTSELPNRPGVS